ncbi:MAG: hypothetical protein, partial [Olavius algarvensis Delta 4 endosymbiont]
WPSPTRSVSTCSATCSLALGSGISHSLNVPESGYSRTLRALEPLYRSTWQIQLSFARAVPITILSGCICERG